MPSGDNQIATKLAVENTKTRMYERVMLLQDGRKKFINQYRRKMTNQRDFDFVIKSKCSYENKGVKDSKVKFSELLRSLRNDDRGFPKTVEKPPESPSPSGSINTAWNVTSRGNLDSGDEELVNILHDLDKSQGVTAEKSPKKVNGRLKGYFCSKTAFNLSRKVLTETEIRVLEKGLVLAPTPARINESDLKRDFNEFS